VNYKESTKTYFDPYYEDDLPYKGTEVAPVRNSENQYNCWFIEDPVKKQLEKSAVVILPAERSLEVIVVVKAPMQETIELFSFMEITHIPDRNSDEPSQKTVVEKRIGADLKITTNHVKVKKQMKVMLLGKLENPTLLCTKAIKDKKSKEKVIPIAVKRGV
jgi:hypothetical protein